MKDSAIAHCEGHYLLEPCSIEGDNNCTHLTGKEDEAQRKSAVQGQIAESARI